MKADEYVKLYNEMLTQPTTQETKDPKLTAITLVCRDLLLEIRELLIKRSAKSAHAIAAVIKEISMKYQAIHRRLNDPEIKPDLFMIAMEVGLPDLYEAYQNFLRGELRQRMKQA